MQRAILIGILNIHIDAVHLKQLHQDLIITLHLGSLVKDGVAILVLGVNVHFRLLISPKQEFHHFKVVVLESGCNRRETILVSCC